MIYDKLSIIFLSIIASEKKDSTNSQIATYILNHRCQLKNIGIKEMAAECNVAISSISRFCKEIGLRDFAELKNLLISTNLHFEKLSTLNSNNERLYEYKEKVNDSIKMVVDSIDMENIVKLCDDIYNYQNIAIFGLLKAGGVALNLQCDLLMLGKQTYTNISYLQQIQYLLNADDKTLIIIFSYTGSYFDYHDTRILKKFIKNPKIWLISSCKKNYLPSIINYITFNSLHDQASHPYQLQFIAGLIAQEYSQRYK